MRLCANLKIYFLRESHMIVVKSEEHSIVHAVMVLFTTMSDLADSKQCTSKAMHSELIEAGFPDKTAQQAVRWINEIINSKVDITSASQQSFRVYEQFEIDFLGQSSIAKLYNLEAEGVLDALTREVVIDRLCALGHEKLDEHIVIWVSLIVLYYTDKNSSALASLENDVLFALGEGVKH